MVSPSELRRFALAFPGSEESPHFEKASFRVKKKIFATLDEQKNFAVLKLSPADQSAFSAFDSSVIHPLDGFWGKQGWTKVNLNKVRKTTLKDALRCAYRNVAPKKSTEKQRKKKIRFSGVVSG